MPRCAFRLRPSAAGVGHRVGVALIMHEHTPCVQCTHRHTAIFRHASGSRYPRTAEAIERRPMPDRTWPRVGSRPRTNEGWPGGSGQAERPLRAGERPLHERRSAVLVCGSGAVGCQLELASRRARTRLSHRSSACSESGASANINTLPYTAYPPYTGDGPRNSNPP